jgi:adenylate cyclase
VYGGRRQEMTYRAKLFAMLLALVAGAGGLLTWANYAKSTGLLQQEVHRKARSIASTTAILLDPDVIRTIRDRSDEASTEYNRIRAQLRAVRDANRRDDVWVERIFTLIPAAENPNVVEYGVDADERFEYLHHAGEIYTRNGAPVSIGLAGIDRLASNLSQFQAGYDSAFAPIRDRSGTLVAELGVTVTPARHSVLREIGPDMLVPFAVTLALALLVATLLSGQVSKPLYQLRQTIEAIGKGDFNVRASAPARAGKEFIEMGAAISAMAAGLRERDTIKRAFSGYISRQVLDSIVANGELPALKGERRRITVLFADIRGFTTMSEAMQPEQVVELLGEFFDRMVEVTLSKQGTIDKFLGDGMMVIFGAPLNDPYQEEHAIAAALEMQRELQKLCVKWQAEGRPRVRMGIGINSGNAVVGNIGSEEHMEYTAIGDTVNLASRLESATKDLDAEIVVSESTYDTVRSMFKWKPTGSLQVRGRSEPVRTYSVEGHRDAYDPPSRPA